MVNSRCGNDTICLRSIFLFCLIIDICGKFRYFETFQFNAKFRIASIVSLFKVKVDFKVIVVIPVVWYGRFISELNIIWNLSVIYLWTFTLLRSDPAYRAGVEALQIWVATVVRPNHKRSWTGEKQNECYANSKKDLRLTTSEIKLYTLQI